MRAKSLERLSPPELRIRNQSSLRSSGTLWGRSKTKVSSGIPEHSKPWACGSRIGTLNQSSGIPDYRNTRNAGEVMQRIAHSSGAPDFRRSSRYEHRAGQLRYSGGQFEPVASPPVFRSTGLPKHLFR